MDNLKFNEMLSKLSSAMPIELAQIPDIDLYMDQVLTFLDEKLKYYKRNDSEKLLTKTMINNYSKDKVLPPPVNKKYSKKHILLLIFVYHMKSVLTINDIATVLKLFENERETDAAAIYDSFITLQKLQNGRISAEIAEKEKEVQTLSPSSDKESTLLMILALIIEANMKISFAQQLIDGLSEKSNETKGK
jgi:hypothetical protein